MLIGKKLYLLVGCSVFAMIETRGMSDGDRKRSCRPGARGAIRRSPSDSEGREKERQRQRYMERERERESRAWQLTEIDSRASGVSPDSDSHVLFV